MKSLKTPFIVFDTWDGIAKEMEEKDRTKTEKTLIAIGCKAFKALGFGIARSNLGLTSRVINIADIHLKMVERNGSVILYGLKPRTPLYVLERDVSMGYPVAKLAEVV